MICKNCNAEIPDAASSCPFCGTPTTVNVDPGASGAVNLSKASESQPGAAPAPQDSQPYHQAPPPQFNNPTPPPVNNQPYGQTPPPVNNQPYGQTPPPQYDATGANGMESEYDKGAKLPFTLGIVGLVANGVGLLGFFCCCWYIPQIVALIVGIIGMVKANKMQSDLYLIAPENQQKMKNGKTMCLISTILAAVGIVLLTILMIAGVAASMSEGFSEYLD